MSVGLGNRDVLKGVSGRLRILHVGEGLFLKT